MACRRCGCRMITKVGRARPMLICTDCGLPMDQRESSGRRRQHLWAACTLMGLTVVGGAMLLLATMEEQRAASTLEGSMERREEASKDEGDREEKSSLLEPSRLLRTSRRMPQGADPRRATGRGDGPLMLSVSAEANAEPADKNSNQNQPNEHKP